MSQAADPPATCRAARRIVTGHDANGRSVIIEDRPAPQFNRVANERVTFHEIWNTAGSPATITAVEPTEPNNRPLSLAPPSQGSIIRFVDFHPGHFRGMTARTDGARGTMHRTATIDYAVVIEGQIWAVMEEGETLMEQGDVLIQRGTDHAWENRSDTVCRMLFVLVDAAFDPELAQSIANLDVTTVPPSLAG